MGYSRGGLRHRQPGTNIMNFVIKTRNFVFTTKNSVFKTRSFVLKMMNFAARLRSVKHMRRLHGARSIDFDRFSTVFRPFWD